MLPQPGSELLDPALRVLADALQHIHEVGVGVDAMQPAGGDQGLDDADVFGAHLGPAEQPVLAPHRDGAQRPLQVIGVDGHVRVTEIDLQRVRARGRVLDRLGQGIAGHQIHALALLLAPRPERANDGLAVARAIHQLGLALKALLADLALVLVELADQLQSPVGGFRFGVLGALELPARVRPAVRLAHPGPRPGIAVIGRVPVADQHALESIAQDLLRIKGTVY